MQSKSIKFHSIELDGKLKLKTVEDKVFGFYLEDKISLLSEEKQLRY